MRMVVRSRLIELSLLENSEVKSASRNYWGTWKPQKLKQMKSKNILSMMFNIDHSCPFDWLVEQAPHRRSAPQRLIWWFLPAAKHNAKWCNFDRNDLAQWWLRRRFCSATSCGSITFESSLTLWSEPTCQLCFVLERRRRIIVGDNKQATHAYHGCASPWQQACHRPKAPWCWVRHVNEQHLGSLARSWQIICVCHTEPTVGS